MTRKTATRLLVFWLACLGGSACYAQVDPPLYSGIDKKPCDFFAKAEAESLLGVTVETRENGVLECWYVETGFTSKAPKNKQADFSVRHWASPQLNIFNERRKGAATSQPSAVIKEVPNFADGAFWIWTPGWGGELEAFKGGTIEADVKITGIPEDAALQSAKTLAEKALGGSAGTGYTYVGTSKSNAAVAAARAVRPPLGAKTFSQAPYVTGGQLFDRLKEVSLIFRPAPSLEKYISAGEQRDDLVKGLSTYGISVKPNSAMTLVATVEHQHDQITTTTARGSLVDKRQVHGIFVYLDVFVRAGALRNGKFHLVSAVPITARRIFTFAEDSDIRKTLMGDETKQTFRDAFVNLFNESLKDLATNQRAEDEPWYVNSWPDKAKAAADADFAAIMRPGVPVEKRAIGGLNSAPKIELEPNTNADGCKVDPSWQDSWRRNFQRLGWIDTQGPRSLTLHHFFSCQYAYGVPPHYFQLYDSISLYESNLVFEFNGLLVRKRAEIVTSHHSDLAIDDITARLATYLPLSISEFLTDLALGN